VLLNPLRMQPQNQCCEENNQPAKTRLSNSNLRLHTRTAGVVDQLLYVEIQMSKIVIPLYSVLGIRRRDTQHNSLREEVEQAIGESQFLILPLSSIYTSFFSSSPSSIFSHSGTPSTIYIQHQPMADQPSRHASTISLHIKILIITPSSITLLP